MIHLTIHAINVKRKLILQRANQIFFWESTMIYYASVKVTIFYPLGYHNDLGKIFKNKT
jgi:hypothetical protein